MRQIDGVNYQIQQMGVNHEIDRQSESWDRQMEQIIRLIYGVNYEIDGANHEIDRWSKI